MMARLQPCSSYSFFLVIPSGASARFFRFASFAKRADAQSRDLLVAGNRTLRADNRSLHSPLPRLGRDDN